MEFPFTSTAFNNEERIPTKYACDGQYISPPLQWSDPPQDTKSFALICDDPDTPRGTWVHWILYNIPASTGALQEAIPSDANLADGSWHGMNNWGRLGYGGPCPPSGTHRYFFNLYALDKMLDLYAGASKSQVRQAMQGHILAQAQLMGKYSR